MMIPRTRPKVIDHVMGEQDTPACYLNILNSKNTFCSKTHLGDIQHLLEVLFFLVYLRLQFGTLFLIFWQHVLGGTCRCSNVNSACVLVCVLCLYT